MIQQIDIRVENETGLHLRPAALFVQTAARFQSDIQVRNITRSTNQQNAKSAVGVMMLKCAQGDILNIRAEGHDAEAAIASLKNLIESNFAL